MNRKHFASRLATPALLGLLPMATGACGFVLTHGPPIGHERMEGFTCTESNTGPILDVVWAGLNLLYGIGILATDDPLVAPRSAGYASIGWSVVSIASAATGFKKTREAGTLGNSWWNGKRNCSASSATYGRLAWSFRRLLLVPPQTP